MCRKEDHTEHSTAVPLTRDEARALRLVANGSAQPALSSPPDIMQLQKLRLVEEVGGVLRLTGIGQDLAADLSQATLLPQCPARRGVS